MRTIIVADWRSDAVGAMQVVSGPIGREWVHFEAPEATRIEAEMAAFFTWFDSTVAVDPLIKAAIAHLWFITIHPFEDGNGRIARAIASMYAKLAKCSTDTALRDIRNLLTQGLLVQNPGGGRSTSYRLPDLGEIKSNDGSAARDRLSEGK